MSSSMKSRSPLSVLRSASRLRFTYGCSAKARSRFRSVRPLVAADGAASVGLVDGAKGHCVRLAVATAARLRPLVAADGGAFGRPGRRRQIGGSGGRGGSGRSGRSAHRRWQQHARQCCRECVVLIAFLREHAGSTALPLRLLELFNLRDGKGARGRKKEKKKFPIAVFDIIPIARGSKRRHRRSCHGDWQ